MVLPNLTSRVWNEDETTTTQCKPKDNVEEPVSKDKPLHDIAGAD